MPGAVVHCGRRRKTSKIHLHEFIRREMILKYMYAELWNVIAACINNVFAGSFCSKRCFAVFFFQIKILYFVKAISWPVPFRLGVRAAIENRSPSSGKTSKCSSAHVEL